MAQILVGQLQCVIVTPEKKAADSTADFVVLTAHDGQIGILPDHAPILCKLAPGLLRIDLDQNKKYFFVCDGFAEVIDNRITVLTQSAIPAEHLHEDEIIHEISEAQNLSAKTEQDYQNRQSALKSARAKLATLNEFKNI